MPVFAVVLDEPSDALNQRIRKSFPVDSVSVSDRQWLIVADTTARALAEQLDLRGGGAGRVMVMEIVGMPSGWHGKSTWEWLKAKLADQL